MKMTLADDLVAFVEEQAAVHGYASANDYVIELIGYHRDVEELRNKLHEGSSSPVEGEMDGVFFQSLSVRSHSRVAIRSHP